MPFNRQQISLLSGKMCLVKLKLQSIIFLVLSVQCCVRAWLLSQVGLNESYHVRHLSTHFSRVFLSITVESNAFPTLIEAQWPESYLPMRTIVYPTLEAHANGDHTDCTRIHQASWTQVDSLSRLWVMDLGRQTPNVTCAPKLLVYDLIRNNVEVLRIDCGAYMTPHEAQSLVLKLGPPPRCCQQVEKYMYFIISSDAHILAYDIVEQHWHRRELVSRKYENVTELFPVMPVDFAFGRERELLVSDTDGTLYTATTEFPSINNAVTNVIGPDDNENGKIELQILGQLIGPSKEMMVDHYGALFYVVPKFGAVVRCKYHQNLTAESNEIIYMTEKNVQQIFFGSEGSVWLLTDRLLKPQDQCFPGM